MNKIEKNTYKKRPTMMIDFIFFIFFLFLGVFFIFQSKTLFSEYKNNVMDEVTRVHTNINENKSNLISKILFLENYFSYIYNQDLSYNKKIDYEMALNKAALNNSYRLVKSVGNNHSVEINIINNEFIKQKLGKDARKIDESIIREINAIQYLFSLLPLTENESSVERRIYYISKSGIYSTTTPNSLIDDFSIESIYERMISQPYYTRSIKMSKISTETLFTSAYDGFGSEGRLTTMSIPVVVNGVVIGVICFDFNIDKIQSLLDDSIEESAVGSYYWIDGDNDINAKRRQGNSNYDISKIVENINNLAKEKDSGSFYYDMNLITYIKIKGEVGVLFVIHTPKQILNNKYGVQFLSNLILLAIFILAMIFSYVFIKRLINKMHSLQLSLLWEANHDMLTKVLNRNGFFYQVNQEINKCQALGIPISFIQIDLDKFKKINDTYGHIIGDAVLIYSSEKIQEMIRDEDIMGRIGGEEFCVVVPGLSLEQAYIISERIRYHLESSVMLIEPNITLNVTASIGVACSSELNSYQIDLIQALADKRLYIAKSSGRNKVCMSG